MKRRNNGLYRRDGVFAFRYKNALGEWREKYTGKKNREDAKEFKNEFLKDLRANSLPTEMGAWNLEAAENWWIEYRSKRVAQSTLNSERYRLQHLRNVVGNLKLQHIENHHLDSYVTARLKEGIGAWSVNKEVLLWSLILKKAKLWARLREDYRPLRTKTSDIGRALTRDELRKLAMVSETNQDWEAAFYGSVLAANTGLRGGEIKKLRIGAINLISRRIIISRSTTKSDAGARHVELNRDAVEAARRLLLRANLLGSNKPDQFLMPKHLSRIAHGPDKGKRGYDPSQHQAYWDTAWDSLRSAAELDGLRFHDLRHTFITHMVERGVPLGVIQTFVGHLSARMVRHYTHVSTGAARAAVELLDRDPLLAPVCGEFCGEIQSEKENSNAIH